MKDFFGHKKKDPLSEALSQPEFDIIETLLWENGSFFLLESHINRLEKSAKHFSFQRDINEVRDFLDYTVSSFEKGHEYRVRLSLKKNGKLQLSSLPLDMPGKLPVKIALSDHRTDKSDEFLYHKTTFRKLYDHELTKYRTHGYFDVIFRNKNNEITEGTISNIMIRTGEIYLTPPVSCGILAGTYRDYLLKKDDFPLKEGILHQKDLESADEIFVINSVRKMIPAVFSK